MGFDSQNNDLLKIKEIKLKRMRILSTGLLIFVTILYFIFKGLHFDQSHNLFLSSLVAFCEASMVGALADWFAVVALFRHPLGMSWIPHTAIIKNNKTQIGDSLAYFVVNNFFTDESIGDLLKEMKFSKLLDSYIVENKDFIAKKIVQKAPEVLIQVSRDEAFRNMTLEGIDNTLEKVKVSQTAGIILDKAVIATGNNIALVKIVIKLITKELENNKGAITGFIQNQRIMGLFSIPETMAEKIYSDMHLLLDEEINNIEKDDKGKLSKILLERLDKFALDLMTSEEVIYKGERLKEDFLSSDVYNNFRNKNLWNVVEDNLLNAMLLDLDKKSEILYEKVKEYIDILIEENLRDVEKSKKIDKWAIATIASLISANRGSIGDLISNTVHQWPENDMVEKLEFQVGSDLQFIRINGTLVGGLVGVLIHLVSHFLM